MLLGGKQILSELEPGIKVEGKDLIIIIIIIIIMIIIIIIIIIITIKTLL